MKELLFSFYDGTFPEIFFLFFLFFSFFFFFVVAHCWFCIWSNRHLHKSLLVAFRCSVLSCGIAVIWGFLCLCVGKAALVFASSCGRVLKQLCLLWFLKLSRLSTGNLSCFPEGGAIAQVCGFYFAHKLGPVF